MYEGIKKFQVQTPATSVLKKPQSKQRLCSSEGQEQIRSAWMRLLWDFSSDAAVSLRCSQTGPQSGAGGER